MKFNVIDKLTGKYPRVENIAMNENWAKDLIHFQIEGFAISEDGELILYDGYGNIAYCPNDRFEIVIEV